MDKRKILESILGESVDRVSLIGIKFYVWDISHRKAINMLLKNGFEQSRNPYYIVFGDIVIKKKPGQHKNIFIVEM